MGANVAGAAQNHGHDLVQPTARIEPPRNELRRAPEEDWYGISVRDDALLRAALFASVVPRVAPRTVHIVQAFLSATCPIEIEPELNQRERKEVQDVALCWEVRVRG